MTIQLITHGDALRHTAKRVVVAVSLTVATTSATEINFWRFDANTVVLVDRHAFGEA